jgi:hypothetical protein
MLSHVIVPGETNLMQRLTKPFGWCKILLTALVLLPSLAANADSNLLPADNGLRECIARARDAGSIAGCEIQEQAALKTRIEHLSTSIRTRLDNPQRLIFERSAKAWQAFFEHEVAMLELSLKLRKDGLGPKLRSGAVSLLYEQRERQLREHLHNISLAGRAVKDSER